MEKKSGVTLPRYFPSFSEGLSLRERRGGLAHIRHSDFPSFSEGLSLRGFIQRGGILQSEHFPSFSEGLSLRASSSPRAGTAAAISLPFRRDFH